MSVYGKNHYKIVKQLKKKESSLREFPLNCKERKENTAPQRLQKKDYFLGSQTSWKGECCPW